MLKDKTDSFIIDSTGNIIMFESGMLPYFSNQNVQVNFFSLISKESKDKIVGELDIIESNSNYQLDTEINLPNYPDKKVSIDLSPLFQYSEPKKIFLVKITNAIDSSLMVKNDSIFEFVFNEISDAVFLTDFEGRFIEMNKTAIKRIGISKSEMHVLSLSDINLINKDFVLQQYFSTLKQNGTALEYAEYRDNENQLVHIEVFGKVIQYLGKDLILHVSHEISPRKREFNQLIDTLIQSEETDRSFFAKEIHEGLGQILSLIKLYMESYFDTDKPEFRNELAQKMDYSINQALSIVSFITEKLSPHILMNLGIEAALNAFIQKLITKSNVKISLEMNFNIKLPDNVEIVLYRIIIDLIEYCLNSSKATVIKIVAVLDKKNIIFILFQNGHHFSLDDFTKGKTNVKLFNLINKIQLLNGSFEVNNTLEKEAQIKIVVPVN